MKTEHLFAQLPVQLVFELTCFQAIKNFNYIKRDISLREREYFF